jgi:osmoprotectant transport system ATP-binding protein
MVDAGQVCVLVGPSGSGKTTAMRLINRMIPLSGGDILIGGQSVLQHDPVKLRREIGYVIQQIGLFPHLDINENIATVPRLLGWDRSRIAARVRELLELIGLQAEIGKRYPAQLSGGQRQRVGVARALAGDPPLLLMDEPFGAIDPINRHRLQDEFLRLQHRLRKTVVFVTHDIDEAIKLGDRIALLATGGVLQQYDTPARILGSPANDFVVEFLGPERAEKVLAVTPINPENLSSTVTDADGSLPKLPISASLGDALALMLLTGSERLLIEDGAQRRGVLSVSDIFRSSRGSRSQTS